MVLDRWYCSLRAGRCSLARGASSVSDMSFRVLEKFCVEGWYIPFRFLRSGRRFVLLCPEWQTRVEE